MSPTYSEKLPLPIIILITISGLIEVVCLTSDFGFFSNTNFRQLFMVIGAFWPALINGEFSGLYNNQKYTMFITHAFLHGNFLHFLMNSVVLLSLGKMISLRLGNFFSMVLFFVSATSGGLVFYLLNNSSNAMIGASGAVFGFIGVWQYYDFSSRIKRNKPIKPFLSTIFALIVGNILIAFLLRGGLAWEAHLGGFIVGFIFVPFLIILNIFPFQRNDN